MNIFKLLILSLFLTLNIYAKDENININNPKIYTKIINDQLSQFKAKYKLSIDVDIIIDEDGYFSYQILNDSDIEGFKDKLENFLEEQTRKKFPIFDNQGYRTKITFIPEDINYPQKDIFYNKFRK